MVRKRCIGMVSQNVYIEDEEAAIHRYLNKRFQSSSKDDSTIKKVYPEPLVIKRVRKDDEEKS